MTPANGEKVLPRPTTLFDLLRYKGAEREERTALISQNGKGEETRLSYRDLTNNSLKLAAGLDSLGVRKGSHVGLLVSNGLEFIEIWFACAALGAIIVPFNIALKGELLRYQIFDSEIEAIFVDSSLSQNMPPSLPEKLRTIIRTDYSSETFPHYERRQESIPIDSIIDGKQRSVNPLPRILPGDPAAILYTSGTTSEPKGVVLSNQAYVNRTFEISSVYQATEGSTFLNVMPLFHTSGQIMTTLPALLCGGTVAIEKWFHASQFWKRAQETDARYSFLLMTMLNILLKRKETLVSHNLETIVCGGANEHSWKLFEQTFGVNLLEGYGMTETCGIAIFNTFDKKKVGSIGTPLPSVEAKILDEKTGKDLGPNMKGEICLRGRIAGTMMLSYYKKDDETRNTVRNGWLHTGDIGYFDTDGFFYFVERIKDIIRRRGENIAPADIERVALLNDEILECAAVGIESTIGEEDVALFLVLHSDPSAFNIDNFLKWLDSELPFYMMPSYVYLIDSLPKTPNQKTQRAKLKKGEYRLIGFYDVKKIGFKPERPPQSQ